MDPPTHICVKHNGDEKLEHCYMVTLSLKLMIIFRVTDCVYIIITPTIMYTLFRTDYKS